MRDQLYGILGSTMKVLLTGGGGQLAYELKRTVPSNIELIKLGKEQLDITNRVAVFEIVEKFQPNLVVNAAAYTAVDKAESDVGCAYAVNSHGPRYLAEVSQQINARLLHISTDFVFDGATPSPYSAASSTNPLSVYGASKREGELAIQELLPGSSVIVRTSWLYSAHGKNFVKTMLRLMAEKDLLSVVSDQVGTPTWAKGLANWLWAVACKPELSGVFHWADAGVASWYDFAVAIQELAIEKNLIDKEIPINPIPASAYQTPAVRPAYSVLDKASAEAAAGKATIHWRKQLSAMMGELKA